MQILPNSHKWITDYPPDWHACRTPEAATMALPVALGGGCRYGSLRAGLLNCHKWVLGDFAERGYDWNGLRSVAVSVYSILGYGD
ncbi:hypothetical protein [Symmachiella macrocystis]|nr:hypothetical protein [Symmachiella macrocystis]